VKAIYPSAARISGDLQNEMLQEFCSYFLVKSPDANNEQEFIKQYKTITLYCKKCQIFEHLSSDE